jgi:Ran GTPase-activating protein (RanGAP) involved in mRNA processing and transport
MLTHTQSLRTLTLNYTSLDGLLLEDVAMATAQFGLKANTTLATSPAPILTSLRDHPLLQRLCLRGPGVNLNGLETELLSDTSQITELEIHHNQRDLTRVLQALGHYPTLTKLRLQGFPLGHDEERQLGMILCNMPSLQTLALTEIAMGSAGLAELAPALYRNTSIQVLDISRNGLNDMESAELLRDIIHSNKTVTTLDFSRNQFGRTTGAVECIAEGLGSNSTLMEINFTYCALEDGGVSTLARNLALGI